MLHFDSCWQLTSLISRCRYNEIVLAGVGNPNDPLAVASDVPQLANLSAMAFRLISEIDLGYNR